jgi:phosphopentomutase
MSGADGVARVIARPFAGGRGEFRRTDGRRDFALAPPGRSYLQELQHAGVEVHGVGKVPGLFAGVGIDYAHAGADNAAALASTDAVLAELAEGLVFVNLIDTDQVYGHRKDAAGFARALEAIDAYVAGLLGRLRPGDLLVLTADHGVDPAHPGTDHTREYAPLLALTGAMLARRAALPRSDGPLADVGATVLAWLAGRQAAGLPGRALIS